MQMIRPPPSSRACPALPFNQDDPLVASALPINQDDPLVASELPPPQLPAASRQPELRPPQPPDREPGCPISARQPAAVHRIRLSGPVISLREPVTGPLMRTPSPLRALRARRTGRLRRGAGRTWRTLIGGRYRLRGRLCRLRTHGAAATGLCSAARRGRFLCRPSADDQHRHAEQA